MTKSFGDLVLFENISLGLSEGQRVGLIAKNGSGKTTLLNILSGKEGYDNGTISFRRDLRVGYLEQDPQYPEELTVLEACFHHGNSTVELIKEYERCMETEGHPGLDEILVRMDHEKAWEYEQKAKQILSQLKIRNFEQQVKHLSGGQLKRVALANALITEPDLLILDEPTNHLDLDMTEWLEEYLRRTNLSLLMVTHDRYFLDNAAEWILELDRGEGIPWKGNYSSWLDQKEKRLEMEKRQNEARSKAIAHELEWVRQNPKGRQAKSKARLAHFEELSSYEYQERNETNEIFIPVADRLGKSVIEFEHVSKGFGDKLLIDDLSFVVPQGAIVGVIGPNGAGKSTLFRMITGKQQPDSGKITIGSTVKLAAVDQKRSSLPNDKTVFDAISDGLDIIQVGKFEMPARSYIGRFNFKGQDQQKRVGDLSGGERGRLHLAKTLLAGGNVLLLDEPSNDLDVETLRALEDALLEFPGCAMVTSHDRWFLDRIATHILAFEGDSKVVFFPGNYQEYEADKKKRLGEAAAAPHRLRFKPLKH